MFRITDNRVTINPDGADYHVYIEGDNDPNLFVTDGTNGRVGIGTSSPSQKLDVNGKAQATAFIADNINGTAIQFQRSGYDTYGFIQSTGTGLEIRNITDARTEMFFNGSGHVGIGTSSPTEKLEVVGTIKATNINFTGLATYADDTAAGVGGLGSGDVYKTATGELRIKL